jgi:DNA-binding NarL/FixJ family response regulator
MEAVFASDPITDSSELWLERVLTKSADLHVVPPPPQHSKPPASKERVKLSRRELEIVRCIASGMRNFEIAERLGIGEQTVKNHLHKAFLKTGVRDRLEMALYAVHHGLYLL